MVAVTTALVTKRTAQMAAKPATVSKAFKALMTESHVFYAARSEDTRPYAYPVDKLNPA
jgi:hypothetical protein